MAGNSSMTDKQCITDLLSSEKFLAGVYNSFCSEAATVSVRQTLCSLLADEHRIGEELFGEMHARGWYPLETAKEDKLNSVKQKFAQAATV